MMRHFLSHLKKLLPYSQPCCIDLPVKVLVRGRAAGISDDYGNFVYLVSVSDFKIDFVLHITRYTKFKIRTDIDKYFSKKYVIRWFCIHHIYEI